MPPVIAALGVAALIGGTVKLFGELFERSEEERRKEAEAARKEAEFRAANGWSLAEVGVELTEGYDRDGDGRLAFDAVQGVRFAGESMKTYRRTYTTSYSGYGIAPGTKLLREDTTRYSIEPMLRKADADKDGIVTAAELQALLKTYDPDGNGRVTRAERSRMHTELGEVRVDAETRTVGVIQPPPPAPAAPAPVRR